MIRMNPIFAASAIVALLTFAAGPASASITAYNGGHPSPAPSAPSAGGGQMVLRGNNCSIRADQLGLASPAWQTYVDRCQRLGVF